MVTDAWHSGGLITAASSRGYRQASFPACSCLLRSAVKTVLRETFLRIFALRMAEEMPVFGEDLAREVGRRYGAPVQMMQLNHGIFDEASISVIAFDTVREIGRLAGRSPDVRRFRPNVVVRLLRSVPFQEDEWLGGVLSFGDGVDAPAITVTMRDLRCSMVNLDPDSASSAPEMMKAVVRANQNNAGIYGAVTRIGRLAVGQSILLRGGFRNQS